MITVCPIKDKSEIARIFSENGFSVNEKSGAVVAENKGEVLGRCLYYLDEKSIVILSVEPKEDLMMADGILRSALHVAAERSAMDAFYDVAADEQLFEKLGFIKSKSERRLDIDKLFGGCCCKI
jgi:N-acetylglutamate synthase-like GNAT family acetyltransferase